MVLISQRHLVRCIKTSFEEFQQFSMQKLNLRSLLSISFILGSISGILMTLLLLKISKYDELLQQTTHPVIVTVHDVSENVVDLYDEVRVLCWVLTQPINHHSKAQAVKDTWGNRCNKLVFISTETYDNLDILLVNITEDRRHLWGKTKQGLQLIYENYGSDYDWFLKADDDTWIFMENLRYFLYSYSPDYPIYFGCKLKRYVKQGYMSGSGYVLSREAVRRFNVEALTDGYKCWNGTEGNEDVEVGKCLANVGVLAGDSRDDLGRHRFNPFPPDGMLRNLFGESWLDNATFYELKMGPECCSSTAISFHYITFNNMYVFDYFLYQMKHQKAIKLTELPMKISWDEVVHHLMNQSLPFNETAKATNNSTQKVLL